MKTNLQSGYKVKPNEGSDELIEIFWIGPEGFPFATRLEDKWEVKFGFALEDVKQVDIWKVSGLGAYINIPVKANQGAG